MTPAAGALSRALSAVIAHAGCSGAGGTGPLSAQLSSELTLPPRPVSSSAALQADGGTLSHGQIFARTMWRRSAARGLPTRRQPHHRVFHDVTLQRLAALVIRQ